METKIEPLTEITAFWYPIDVHFDKVIVVISKWSFSVNIECLTDRLLGNVQ